MREKLLFASLLVFVLTIGGCSKKEEGPSAEELAAMEAASIPDKPAIGSMVLIPAGEFTMGSSKKIIAPNYAAPEQKVNLPAYYIDAYEVTFGQWIEFTTKTNFEAESNWRSFYTVGKENFPVANITLDDAKAYAKWAGKRLRAKRNGRRPLAVPRASRFPGGTPGIRPNPTAASTACGTRSKWARCSSTRAPLVSTT